MARAVARVTSGGSVRVPQLPHAERLACRPGAEAGRWGGRAACRGAYRMPGTGPSDVAPRQRTPARLWERTLSRARMGKPSDATGGSPQFAVFAGEGLPLGPGDEARVVLRMLSAGGPGREVVQSSVTAPRVLGSGAAPWGSVTVAGSMGNEEGAQQGSAVRGLSGARSAQSGDSQSIYTGACAARAWGQRWGHAPRPAFRWLRL